MPAALSTTLPDGFEFTDDRTVSPARFVWATVTCEGSGLAWATNRGRVEEGGRASKNRATDEVLEVLDERVL